MNQGDKDDATQTISGRTGLLDWLAAGPAAMAQEKPWNGS
jgi:hypothetical protein